MNGAQKTGSRCTSIRRITAGLLLSFLAFSSPVCAALNDGARDGAAPKVLLPIPQDIVPEGHPAPGSHKFTLKHVFHHGAHRNPNLFRRRDVRPDTTLRILNDDGTIDEADPLIASSHPITIQRLKDRRPSTMESMLAASRAMGVAMSVLPSAWTMDEVAGPNITDKATVLTLATIASNAYIQHQNSSDWVDVGGGFNRSLDIGWESDGLRGHVFTDEDESIVVIGIKGTSAAVFDGDQTTTNDKLNDNLFGSCCCAQQGAWTWRQVCDCATSAYSCNNTCVVSALRNESRYYSAARHLYSNVSAIYPDANIWVVGHSLGGLVSSLIGLTFGRPTVTFQAVPDVLAANRLGLPPPPGSVPGQVQTRSFTGAYHIGHTADPVYMGSCNGATSSCSFAGYAFEAQCHTSKSCVYDVVGDKGWRVSMTTHPILVVIKDVIKQYDTVPECVETPECQDCFAWKFYESHNSTSTTTSMTSTSTTRTNTRTSTCKTPGWWGCLDETTTTESTTTSTTTTKTCETPGWFGCLDESTTASTTTTEITTTTSTSTTTCETPGWWGCKDKTTSTEGLATSTTSAEMLTVTPMPTPAPDLKMRAV